jgi:hypothetical protein
MLDDLGALRGSREVAICAVDKGKPGVSVIHPGVTALGPTILSIRAALSTTAADFREAEANRVVQP